MWVAFFLFSISQSYCAVVIKVILHVELNDFIMELEPMWLLLKWYVWKEQIIRTQRGRIIEDRRFSNSRNDCEVTEKNISICWLSSAPGLEVLCILGGGWAGLGLTFLFYIQKFNVIIPPPILIDIFGRCKLVLLILQQRFHGYNNWLYCGWFQAFRS